jgi:GntR family transcriptional regulator
VFIDPKNHVPIFQQIAAQLRKQISDGVYKAGEVLPSLRVMAVDIRVNPNTVQRAYELLEREGVVESRRGVGVFVTKIDRRRQSRNEKKTDREFVAAIRSAVEAGLSPDRIRQVFDHAMAEIVREATKS